MRIKAARDNGGFTVVENELISDESLSRNAKTVYMVLAFFSNSQTDKCYPTIATIQDKAGLTDKPVTKAIRELESAGWISRSAKLRLPYGITPIRSSERLRLNKT